MGTSRSFRAPLRPRWQAFVAALAGEDADRARSELFNAAEDWEAALAAPSVASYAASISELFTSLPVRLIDADQPAVLVSQILDEARQHSRDTGGSSADVFAERAFAAVLLRTMGGATDTGDVLAARWTQTRGAGPEQLVAEFASNIFRQFATHYADRQAGALVEAGNRAAATGQTTQRLADRAAELAVSVWRQSPNATWSRLVSTTLDRGAELPESDQ